MGKALQDPGIDIFFLLIGKLLNLVQEEVMPILTEEGRALVQ